MNNQHRKFSREQTSLKHVPSHFASECRVDPQLRELLGAK
jgi:hypothetical protein